MNQSLYLLLKERKDQQALEIIKENPQLADNTVIRLALDNRCFKTINFLRELDVITLEGKIEREDQRLQEYRQAMGKLENIAGELEAHFRSSRREKDKWKK